MSNLDIINVRNQQWFFFIEIKAYVIGLQDLSDEKLFLEKKKEIGMWIAKLVADDDVEQRVLLKIQGAYTKISNSYDEVYGLVNQSKTKEAREALKLLGKRSKILLTLLDNLIVK